jgi:hypothetical protein
MKSQSLYTISKNYKIDQINVREMEEAIKNGQSRETGNKTR